MGQSGPTSGALTSTQHGLPQTSLPAFSCQVHPTSGPPSVIGTAQGQHPLTASGYVTSPTSSMGLRPVIGTGSRPYQLAPGTATVPARPPQFIGSPMRPPMSAVAAAVPGPSMPGA